AFDVHCHDLSPSLLGERLGRATLPYAGITDQIVDRPARHARHLDGPLGRSRRGHIGHTSLSDTAMPSDLLTSRLQIAFGATDQQHSSVSGQSQRNGPADAPTAACDD